jgi:opacity protein-like surface antigen
MSLVDFDERSGGQLHGSLCLCVSRRGNAQAGEYGEYARPGGHKRDHDTSGQRWIDFGYYPAMRLAYMLVVALVLGVPAAVAAQDQPEEDLGASGGGADQADQPDEKKADQPTEPDAVAGEEPNETPPAEPVEAPAPPPPPAPPAPPPTPAPTPAIAAPEPPPATETVERTVEAPAATSGGKIRGGFKGGVGGGTWLQADGAKTHLGLALGAFMVIPLADPLSLQPELLMMEKGADFIVLDMDADEGLLYVELLVPARYDVSLSDSLSLFGFAGPALSYAIDSKLSPKSDLRRWDVSVTGGVGVDVDLAKHDILVDLRVDAGLLNQLDRPGGDKARNLTLALMAGVTL